jgi:outer membrane lipoprotein-sorting protein
MRHPRPFITYFALLFATVSGVASAAELNTVLARMNSSAVTFRSMKADLVKISHTEVVNDDSRESGNIAVLRKAPGSLRMLIQITKPEQRAAAFAGKEVQVYYPKMKTVQIYDLGKQSQLVDQFMLLGFGTSGTELRRNYKVSAGGTETLDGTATTRLDLTPLSKEVSQHFEKLQLWISDEGGYPVRQKLIQPSGDYILITYSSIRINPPLTQASVELTLPSGVKKQKMR